MPLRSSVAGAFKDGGRSADCKSLKHYQTVLTYGLVSIFTLGVIVGHGKDVCGGYEGDVAITREKSKKGEGRRGLVLPNGRGEDPRPSG